MFTVWAQENGTWSLVYSGNDYTTAWYFFHRTCYSAARLVHNDKEYTR